MNDKISNDQIANVSKQAVAQFVEEAKQAAKEVQVKKAQEQALAEEEAIKNHYFELAQGDDEHLSNALKEDEEFNKILNEKGDIFRKPAIALGLSNLDSNLHPMLIKDILNDENKLNELNKFAEGNLQVNQSKASRYLSKIAHQIFNSNNQQNNEKPVNARPSQEAKNIDNISDDAFNAVNQHINKFL